MEIRLNLSHRIKFFFSFDIFSLDVNPHLFRDAINTNWVENSLLDEGIRAILLNQKPSGINAGHFLKWYT